LRFSEKLVAVNGDQGLVGGDDVLAVGECAQHQFAGQIDATDHLADDVDFRVINHVTGVG